MAAAAPSWLVAPARRSRELTQPRAPKDWKPRPAVLLEGRGELRDQPPTRPHSTTHHDAPGFKVTL